MKYNDFITGSQKTGQIKSLMWFSLAPPTNPEFSITLYLETVNNSPTESEESTMYYTQEQIDRANQTNLVSFLQAQGEQLARAGNEYR